MTRPIRVFVLIKGLAVGGAERLVVAALAHRNRTDFAYEVGYLTPGRDTLVPELLREDIPVFCLSQRWFYDPLLLLRLTRLLRRRKVDVLHIHSPYAAFAGRIAGRLAGVKAIVYTEHSPVDWYPRRTRWMDRLTYRANDAVIAVSEYVRSSIESTYRLGRGPRAQVIHNGVELSGGHSEATREEVRREFGVPLHHYLVTIVANLHPNKGHSTLLRAAREVLSEGLPVTFMLAGEGPEGDSLRALARELGIEERVVFTGYRPDIFRLLEASDVFVLPSFSEGLPVSLLEAMSHGLPVVSTRVGGVPELVTEGVNGFLTSPGDWVELSARIQRLLHDPELRESMGRANKQRIARHFALTGMVAKTEQLYLELVCPLEPGLADNLEHAAPLKDRVGRPL